MRKLSPALSIYQRHEEKQNSLDDLSRLDMHFRFKSGADIVIEETGLHVKNPFKYKIDDLIKWSKDQNENLNYILENYIDHYELIKNKLDNESTPIYKPYFKVDGYDEINFSDTDSMIRALQERINYLRINDDSLEAYTEIEHRKKNLFELYYLINGKNLENPMLKTYLDDLTLTNQITLLQGVKERERQENDPINFVDYKHKQRIYSLGEIIEMTTDPKLAYIEKEKRPLVFGHSSGKRLVSDDIYADWNGLQIFDIDLKFSKVYEENPNMDASEHRDIIFEKLKHYTWFVGVTLSASRRAIHVYTKVSRLHNLFDDRQYNSKIQMYWYRMSYIQKYASIAYVLDKFCGINDVYSGNVQIGKDGRKLTKQIIDGALAKVTQGIAINYDPNGKWSSGFIDLYPCFLYHVPPVKGIELEDWLLKDEIKQKFNTWLYEFEKDGENDGVTVDHKSINFIVDNNITLDGVKQIDMNNLAKGEKHSIRWRVCNTIISAYGDTDLASELCHHILQTNQNGTVGQINAFIRTAVIHKKEGDIGTIKLLKNLGLKINLDEETNELLSEEIIDKVEYSLKNNDYSFYNDEPNINIELLNGEYLGMKMNLVLNSIRDFKINVIESAPNTGKTEFFKSLAKHKTVCLVIPFTSTIVAKIINDEEINSLFDVYYDDKSISNLKKGRSVVMTFDKFASMPKSRYAMFDYIAIDESHLLFTSIYRLSVVSQTIENIRTFLLEDSIEKQKMVNTIMSFKNVFDIINPIDNTNTYDTDSTKFILMSGTLTGELDYFKYYGLLNHIKVHKKHPHNKKLTIHLSKYKETIDVALIKKIIDKLREGEKVIHPTNRGDTYTKQLVRCIESELNRPIKFEYYKRANNDEEFMENINSNTTVEDTEILFCSDYLSVGIDIKDKGKFALIFGSDFTAEAIEQFNNRLRSTDIDCHIFYDVVDDAGMQKSNIINTNHIRYEHNNELKNMVIDELNIANLQKEINTKQQYHVILGELFSKYFIEDYSGKIKYIKSAFEIEQFELQYTKIAKSLLYIKTSLTKKYQYDFEIIKYAEYSEATLERYDIMRKEAKEEHDILKSQSFTSIVDFLSDSNVYDTMITRDIVFVKDNLPIEDGGINLHLGFDENYLGGSYILTWNKIHKYSLDDAKKFTKKIRRLYNRNTILEIIKNNTKSNGIIQKIELKRYLELMELLFKDKKNNLSDSTKEILEMSYNYVDPSCQDSMKISRFDFDTMKLEIRDYVLDSYFDMTNSEIVSERRQEDVNNLVNKFIDTIFVKRVGKENVTIGFRKIYSFNSESIQEQMEHDKIYRMILLNDNKEIDFMETENLSENHVIDLEIPVLFNT